MLFPSTLPAGEPDLMRVSAFRRQFDATGTTQHGELLATHASRLGPSLLQDLLRFEKDGATAEPLEVFAACLRHGRNLLVHLQFDERVLPLTIFPSDGLVHSPVPLATILEWSLSDLHVLGVEPPTMRPPGARQATAVASDEFWPLSPLLWELALRGSRGDLLPEIFGNAAYRIAPGVDLGALPLSGTLSAAVHRLKRQTSGLREIASWPGFDRERAMRLLNGLYLQAGLMISRTHPAATNDG